MIQNQCFLSHLTVNRYNWNKRAAFDTNYNWNVIAPIQNEKVFELTNQILICTFSSLEYFVKKTKLIKYYSKDIRFIKIPGY